MDCRIKSGNDEAQKPWCAELFPRAEAIRYGRALQKSKGPAEAGPMENTQT
jgi:hypothetical protein